MKGLLSVLGKAGLVIAALIAVFAAVVYNRFFAPGEFSPRELDELCAPAYEAAGFELSSLDSVDKGGKTDKWMDSSSYCRLSSAPDRVRSFKDKLRAAHVPDPNLPAGGQADIFSCEFYGPGGRKLPGWWQGGDRPGAACYSVDEPGGGRGVRLVIFEAEGMVFAERWHN